ncbi:hypothetical protein [Stigmatella aurantiaca]|uniref:Conserved uncharacterized protein n=1 Tax=Stigmatella aurantiaca (strain DW4/3-1) TaxID=378806 RepID=Q08QE9_STIAD|nr:hypothetical protein [Stigmatella aurantiaca]ADO71873.1 conserved uncharacterized protein [Stigmatella aurantiaca DW4/3-1]EAU62708.1 conserved hypothetical protein [Stigmatella aurantiaca DW4/3-1]
MDQVTAEPAVSPAPRSLVANTFSLRNRRISVTFSATSITGAPLLHYQDRQREVNARGEDIRQVVTEIGTVVSITLEPDADAGSLIFSVLIPRVSLTATGSTQAVSTVGFLTRSRLPPRLPVNVQLQTYEQETLNGSATFVVS